MRLSAIIFALTLALQAGVAQADAPPSPAVSVDPSCNSEAKVSHGVNPTFPDSARNFKFGIAVVLVDVHIDYAGNLITAMIYKSSGMADLDASAIAAARASTYTPKRVNCKPVSSHSIMRFQFNSN